MQHLWAFLLQSHAITSQSAAYLKSGIKLSARGLVCGNAHKNKNMICAEHLKSVGECILEKKKRALKPINSINPCIKCEHIKSTEMKRKMKEKYIFFKVY